MLEKTLNVLLAFNYTNEEYKENEQRLGWTTLGLETKISENLVMEFTDNSTIKTSYRSYAGITHGTINLDGQGFIFSLFSGNRWFYNAAIDAIKK